jgi:SprB repeat
MKKLVLLFSLGLSVLAKAQVVTSIAPGSATSTSTWDCACVPGSNADLVINHAVTLASGSKTYGSMRILPGASFSKNGTGAINIRNQLRVDAGGTFNNSARFNLGGNYWIDGTHSGTGITAMTGVATTIRGTGVITNLNTHYLSVGNKTILVGTALEKAAGNVELQNNITVTNNGTIELVRVQGAGTWTQGTNASLSISSTISPPITFNTSATGNTVRYNGANAGVTQRVETPSDGSYYNLTLEGTATSHVKRPLADVLVTNDLTVTSCTFDVRRLSVDYNVTVQGDWLVTGTFLPRLATVTIGGTGPSVIQHPLSQEFKLLVIAGSNTVSLQQAISVDSNLTINSTLDPTTSNHAITCRGNWTNNGTFLRREGLVTLSGVVPQTLSGSTAFHDLTVNNTSSGVSITSGTQELHGTLTLTDGTLTTNNDFFIISGAAGDARVAPVTGGTQAGPLWVQRYIDAGATNWRLLTAAVQSGSLGQWDDDFVTSGYPQSDFPTFSFTSIYNYDETVPGVKDNGFVEATGDGQAISAGEGFWVWCGDTITGTQPFDISVSGPLYIGNVDLPVSYTNSGNPIADGYTVVGNPYASVIDWDSPNWVKTNINDAIYIWDPDLQAFASYVGGVGVNGGTNLIASSQGFEVQANGPSPVLRITENVKSATAVGFKNATEEPSVLRVRMVGHGLQDEVLVRVQPDATDGFDKKWDAYERWSWNTASPNLCLMFADGGEGMVQTVAPFSESKVFDLTTKVGEEGEYEISLAEVSGAFAASCFVLEDLALNKSIELTEGATYTFTLASGYHSGRFKLRASAPMAVDVQPNTCTGASDGAVVVRTAQPVDLIWKNAEGKVLHSTHGVLQDMITGQPEGTYRLLATGACAQGEVTVRLEAAAPLQVLCASTNASSPMRGDGSLLVNAVGGTAPYRVEWSDGTVGAERIGLAEGTYAFELVDAQGCRVRSTGTVKSEVGGVVEILQARRNGLELLAFGEEVYLRTDRQRVLDVVVRNVLGQTLAWPMTSSRVAAGSHQLVIPSVVSQALLISATDRENGEVTTLRVVR